MLFKIAGFELRYQLRSSLFLVGFAIFFLLTFGSVTIDQIQIGARGNVNVNSPYALLQTTGIMSVFAVFIVTAFVANVVIRDAETGFAPILYSTRITKASYLGGRFLGAMIVAAVLLASVPLAFMIGSAMPWLDHEKVGPFVLGHYLYALFLFGLPALLVTGAGFFSLATVTRSMMWSYVGAVAFITLYFTSMILLKDPAYDHLTALLDPFGLSALDLVSKYWTAAERNTLLPAMDGVMLENRLIWVGVALALFALACLLFRFESKGGRRRREVPADAAAPPSVAAIRLVSPARDHGWQAFLALTRFEMRTVFKSPAFFVLLAIGVLNSWGSLQGVITDRDIDYLPVTRAVVEALQGAFTMIPVIIAIYYSGELVWRDRERRIHEIVDSTPAPSWTMLLPKVLAVGLVLAATLAVGALTGMLFQLAHGYTKLEALHYLLWFLIPETITAWLLAVLAVFVQSLVPHKAVGWAVMLLYIVANVTLGNLGYEHGLYRYAHTIRVPISDMNGLGRFWIGQAWFDLYWTAFAVILLVVAHLLWRRGAETRLKPRLALMRANLTGGPVVFLILAGLVMWGTAVNIFDNVNVLNDYSSSTKVAKERYAADYEKALWQYHTVPQPKIVAVTLNVALHPKQVRAETEGSYTIENRTGQPLSELHVRWQKPLRMEMLDVGEATLEKDYKTFDYRIYRFATPMAPGERRTIRFKTVLEERGFPNNAPLTRIVENGTFLNNSEIAPRLGIDANNLLTDRGKRRKYGLAVDALRPPKLEDEKADAVSMMGADSDWVDAQITLSTDADQVPLAPGYTVSDETRNGRRTIVTRTEAPILDFFSLQSARYAIARDVWKGENGQNVDLAVYYHPDHPYNVQRIIKAMKASLDVYTKEFSPYQFRQLRILEFPAYERFAQSFANTIPFSESIGFVQDFKDAEADEKVDLVTFVTAHEIGHQWWAHQVIGADKQGATMLDETFAQYSALLVMEKLYGKDQIRKFLKGNLDDYLRNRGTEAVEELPLDRVENQPYIHYRKGAVEMYWLKETVGEDKVNAALRQLLAKYAFKAAPYPSTTDFLAMLKEQAGPAFSQQIDDQFDRITLYDLKATDAKGKKREDGKYEVSFTVQAKKFYADGQGKESEQPLDEVFEVGAFTVEPGKKGYSKDSVLDVERRPLKSGKQEVTLVLDKEPKLVGIDPFNKRIDRNSDDNLTPVSME
jgi:aminopeptidase N